VQSNRNPERAKKALEGVNKGAWRYGRKPYGKVSRVTDKNGKRLNQANPSTVWEHVTTKKGGPVGWCLGGRGRWTTGLGILEVVHEKKSLLKKNLVIGNLHP